MGKNNRDLPASPVTLTDDQWKKMLTKLDDTSSAARRGVGNQEFRRFRMYNAASSQAEVTLRRNSGTVASPGTTSTLLKVKVESGETLDLQEITTLAANEQVDAKLTSAPTTDLDCSPEGMYV